MGILNGDTAPDEEIAVDVKPAANHNKDILLETIISQDQVVDELDTAPVATENVGRDPAAKREQNVTIWLEPSSQCARWQLCLGS